MITNICPGIHLQYSLPHYCHQAGLHALGLALAGLADDSNDRKRGHLFRSRRLFIGAIHGDIHRSRPSTIPDIADLRHGCHFNAGNRLRRLSYLPISSSYHGRGADIFSAAPHSQVQNERTVPQSRFHRCRAGTGVIHGEPAKTEWKGAKEEEGRRRVDKKAVRVVDGGVWVVIRGEREKAAGWESEKWSEA